MRTSNEFGDGIIIPKRVVFEFPKKEISSYPRFLKREGGVTYNYPGANGFEWSAREADWHPVLRHANSLHYKNANHTQTWWKELYGDECKNKKEYNINYFAKKYNSGEERNFSYVCLSNPAVFDKMVWNLAERDRLNAMNSHSADDKIAIYHLDSSWYVTPPDYRGNRVFFACNDGLTSKNVCRCSNCSNKLSKHSNTDTTATDLIFGFVNRYVDTLNKMIKGRRLSTIAHGFYRAPTSGLTLNKMIDLAYVSPKIHLMHSDSKEYAKHLDYVKKWYKILDGNKKRLTCWMNITAPKMENNIMSFAPVMYPNTLKKWLLDTDTLVSGFYINGLNPYTNNQDYYNLVIQSLPMIYLQGKLMWNPDVDIDSLLNDYCNNLYGHGSDDMLNLYRTIIACWEKDCGGDADILLDPCCIHKTRFTIEKVRFMEKCLDNAYEKTKKQHIVHRRIAYLKNNVYKSFFDESDKYAEKCK